MKNNDTMNAATVAANPLTVPTVAANPLTVPTVAANPLTVPTVAANNFPFDMSIYEIPARFEKLSEEWQRTLMHYADRTQDNITVQTNDDGEEVTNISMCIRDFNMCMEFISESCFEHIRMQGTKENGYCELIFDEWSLFMEWGEI